MKSTDVVKNKTNLRLDLFFLIKFIIHKSFTYTI